MDSLQRTVHPPRFFSPVLFSPLCGVRLPSFEPFSLGTVKMHALLDFPQAGSPPSQIPTFPTSSPRRSGDPPSHDGPSATVQDRAYRFPNAELTFFFLPVFTVSWVLPESGGTLDWFFFTRRLD